MKKTRLLLLWCLLLGTFVSCTKKDTEAPQPVSPANNDYFPATANSSWDYAGSSPYRIAATGGTQGFGGKTFQEFEITEKGVMRKGYVRKENGVYYSIGMINTQAVETVFLKENAPVGDSWEYSVPFTTAIPAGLSEEEKEAFALFEEIETKIKYTITAKDIEKTVEGKTYKNVISLKYDVNVDFFGQNMAVVSANYFFAKGVGLILSDLGTLGQIPLKTYVVK